jgi:hypothetical protein
MEEQMQYQAEMLAQVLRLAQVKVQALVQAAPPRLEVEAVLLQREVLAVLQQAVALQQLVALPQEQEVPLLELGVPQEVLRQADLYSRQGIEQLALRAIAQAEAGGWAMARAMEQVDSEQALVEAEAQVEVLEPQERELVEVPLLEME